MNMIDMDVFLLLHKELDTLNKNKAWKPLKQYPLPPDAKPIKHHTRQRQLGRMYRIAKNMILSGHVSAGEMRFLTRHVYILLEAEKHHLDWKKSEADNHIDWIRERWETR